MDVNGELSFEDLTFGDDENDNKVSDVDTCDFLQNTLLGFGR